MNDFQDLPGPNGPELHCEEVPLARIADAVGTPVYVYASATLERHYRVFREAFRARRDVSIAYAVKANGSLSVLSTLARLGAGADTVSEGEIRRALAAGVPASRIVFSGVGKTDAELAFALDAGVAEINVESEPELERLAALARAKGARPTVALRVNPDVGAGGHPKITTGSDGNLWFPEPGYNQVGKIIPSTGVATSYNAGTYSNNSYGIASGSDGNLYFGTAFGNNIAEMQYTQKRLADLAIDLFAIAAVVARTSRAIERRGEEGSRREIDLTGVFVTSAKRRMFENVSAMDENDDELRKSIAQRTCTDGGYPLDVI